MSRVWWYTQRKWRVPVRMIWFISSLVAIFLDHIQYSQYSAIADLHTFQFTVAHAIGFSVFTSRILITDLNTGIITAHWMTHFKYHTEIKSSNHAWSLPILTSFTLLDWIGFSYKSQCNWTHTGHLLWLAGLRWRYSTPPPHGNTHCLGSSQSYVTTDGSVGQVVLE
jgi:hypothetical protein